MAAKRKTKRKTSKKPLVTNPFDAAKRKKLALLHVDVSGKDRKKKRDENKESEKDNKESETFSSALPFESQTQEYSQCLEDSNHSNSNPSQTWLRFKSFDGSQSFDEYNSNTNQYLTPLDQPQQTHLSQYDIVNNRIFNHTKSKIKTTITECDENKYNEYISKKDLKIPSKNKFLDSEEIIDIFAYKKQQKGIVLAERYNLNYDQIELLGNGSFGKVYKCRNRNDGCFYAIKKIKVQSIHKNTQYTKEKYMKEGYVLSSLQRNGNICENIILYNNMWIEYGHFYLVTEYLDNGNLYNLYNINIYPKINEDIFCKIIQNISNALLFIHNKGFVHFDVKPENILIAKNGLFKLADFGLCMKVSAEFNKENRNKSNAIPKFTEGDARYLCRELIQESYILSELDKIDIFALGLSIYEMIIGKDLPSNGFKWQQLRNGNLSWNNSKAVISNNMKQLIMKMIDANPNERPSAKQLNIFLRKFNDQELQSRETLILQLKKKIKMLLQQTQQ